MLLKIFYFTFISNLIINLERYTLINELYSLAGILTAYCYFLNNKKLISINHWSTFKYFALYATLHFFISFFRVSGHGLAALRTYPIFYSYFSIYLGIFLYRNKEKISNYFGGISFLLPVFFGGVLSNSSALVIMTGARYLKYIPAIFLVMIAYKNGVIGQGSSTLVLNFIFFLMVLTFGRKNPKFFALMFSPIAAFLAFAFLIPFLLYIYPFISFMTESGLIQLDFIDPNNLWRLLFWAKSLTDILNDGQLLFGKGLGVPLFDYDSAESKFLLDANPDDANLAYTIGLHNSYIYILIRYGLLGFLLFLIPFFNMLSRSIIATRFSGMDGLFVIALLFMSINAFFNVIIESPLYASTFWILTGYCLSIAINANSEALERKEEKNV